MDLTTLVTAISTSGAVVAGAGYLLKRSLDRAIQTRFRIIQDAHAAEIKELTRRSGAIFDEQFAVLRTALSLVYRVRNAARELFTSTVSERPNELGARRMRTYGRAIQELLYEERAILPEQVFKLAHDIGHTVDLFENLIRQHDRDMPVGSSPTDEPQIQRVYGTLDEGYRRLVSLIQDHLGVQRATNEPEISVAAAGANGAPE